MSLKGNLDPTFLSSLFQIFCDEKKTGLFTADCDGLRVDIYIQDGVIVHATGHDKTYLMAEILLARGILPPDQVEKTVSEAKQSDNTIGRALLDLGFLDEPKITPLVEDLAKDLFICLFQQTSGEFEYDDKPLETQRMVMIHLDIRRAIFDTFRLLDELKEFKKKLPDDSVRFAMVEKSQQNTAYQLDAVAWRILSLIHAKQPLKEILKQSSYNPHVVYTALLSLMDANMVTFAADWEDDIHSVDAPVEEASSDQEMPPHSENKSKEKGLFGFFKKK